MFTLVLTGASVMELTMYLEQSLLWERELVDYIVRCQKQSSGAESLSEVAAPLARLELRRCLQARALVRQLGRSSAYGGTPHRSAPGGSLTMRVLYPPQLGRSGSLDRRCSSIRSLVARTPRSFFFEGGRNCPPVAAFQSAGCVPVIHVHLMRVVRSLLPSRTTPIGDDLRLDDHRHVREDARHRPPSCGR